MLKSISTLIIAGAGMVLATGCQTTQTPTDIVTTEAADAEDVDVYEDGVDPNKVVCKTKQATGSRIGRVKDCRTVAQWKRSSGNANRSVGALINDASRSKSE